MPRPLRAAAGGLEQLVRACLAATAVALLGGPVASEYVGAGAFAYVVPAVLGVLAGAAAGAASGGAGRTPPGAAVRVAGAAYGVLGVALGFLLEGSRSPLSAGALGPYAAAAAGALLWTRPVPVRRGGRAR